MRRFIIIGLAGALLAVSSVASAHNGRWAWAEWKARQTVVRDASVRLPAAEAAPLARELRESVRLYRGLLLATAHQRDGDVEGVYQSLLARYTKALDQVENGLVLDAAACKGTGTALQSVRYKHYRCAVTSESLEIPTAQLDYGDRDLPLVIEGAPRVVGPLEADLDVHVTGKSSIAFRQMPISS